MQIIRAPINLVFKYTIPKTHDNFLMIALSFLIIMTYNSLFT
jgi:hypothetical protein